MYLIDLIKVMAPEQIFKVIDQESFDLGDYTKNTLGELINLKLLEEVSTVHSHLGNEDIIYIWLK